MARTMALPATLLALLVLLASISATSGVGWSDDPPAPAPTPAPPAPPPPDPPSTPWATSTRTPGTCAVSGTCGVDSRGAPRPCAANTPATPLDPLAASVLVTTCPGLTTKTACCDAAQVAWLAGRLAEAASYVGACPACEAGIRALWCGLVCGPDQSLAWNVTAAEYPGGNATAGLAASAATVWLAPKAAAALHEACRGVVLPGGRGPAISALVGGGAIGGGAGAWLSAWSKNDSAAAAHPASPAGGIALAFNTNPPPPEAVNSTAFTVTVPPCAGSCGCADCPSAPTSATPNASTCPAPPPRPPPPPTGCVPLGLGRTHVTCGGLAAAAVVAGLALTFPALASALATAGSQWPPTAVGGRLEPLLSGWSQRTLASAIPPAEAALSAWFSRCGLFAADAPRPLVVGALLAVGLASLGALLGPSARSVDGLAIIGDRAAALMYAPTPGSRAAREAAVVQRVFGSGAGGSPPVRKLRLALQGRAVVSAPALAALFDIHDFLASNVTVPAPHDALAPPPAAGMQTNLTLADVCARSDTPTSPCAVTSPLAWWGFNRTVFEEAVATNATATCADMGGGSCTPDPLAVLGWSDDGTDRSSPPSSRATVLFIEFDLNGSSPAAAARARLFESAAVAAATRPGGAPNRAPPTPLGKIAASANLTLTIEAERSLGDELAREAFQKRRTGRLARAGLLTAIFWAAALSRRRLGAPPADAALTTRVGLGLAAVLLCALSSAAGAGLAGWAGVEAAAAPFVLAALPVMCLATLADGAAFMVAAFDAAPASAPVRSKLALALASAGPAQAAAAAAQFLALLAVAASGPPAERGAAAAEALATAVGFGLLLTLFAAVLAADARRAAARRLDVCPFITLPPTSTSWEAADTPAEDAGAWEAEPAAGAWEAGTDTGTDAGPAPLHQHHPGVDDATALWAGALPGLSAVAALDAPPRLSSPGARAGITAAAVAILGIAAAALPGTRPGLDPVDALPPASYLRAYRSVAAANRRVGPPLDIILSDVALSPAGLAAVCGHAPGCRPNSLVSTLAAAAATPDGSAGTWMAAPPSSWPDALLAWADPAAPGCCSVQAGTAGEPCPVADAASSTADCAPCFNGTAWPALDAAAVAAKLPWFLDAAPRPPACAVGGIAFAADLSRSGAEAAVVTTSRLRTTHVPLRTPADLPAALVATRRTVDAAAARAGVKAFPYARWHGVAEREARAGRTLVRGVLLASVAVAAGALAALGCPRTAIIASASTAGTGVLALAFLRLSGAPINAASAGAVTASLAATAGPSLHLCTAYARADGSAGSAEDALYHDLGRARVASALCAVGAPALVGGIATKLVAVAALRLAGSRSGYTPLASALVACALATAFISLVLLPSVVLPLVGPAHRPGPGLRRRRGGGLGGGGLNSSSDRPPAPLTDPASVWPADDSVAGAWPVDDTGTPPPEAASE